MKMMSALATILVSSRCRANVAHIRQSRPDSGLGFIAKVLKKYLLQRSLKRTFIAKVLKKLFPFCAQAANIKPCAVNGVHSLNRPES